MRATVGNSGNANFIPAILTDFDDTAAAQNVGELVLSRFGGPGWKDIRSRFRTGEISLKEYQEVAFRHVRADRSAIQAYVKEHASFRPYFKDLWIYCRAHQMPMAVVSLGLDVYIEALLQREGFSDLPVYSVNTQFTPQGITYEYRHVEPDLEQQGNSKALIVKQYQRRGYQVWYVGDGRADFPPAALADVVFAHSTLAEECGRHQVPFHPFRDFGDLLAALKLPRGHEAIT